MKTKNDIENKVNELLKQYVQLDDFQEMCGKTIDFVDLKYLDDEMKIVFSDNSYLVLKAVGYDCGGELIVSDDNIDADDLEKFGLISREERNIYCRTMSERKSKERRERYEKGRIENIKATLMIAKKEGITLDEGE